MSTQAICTIRLLYFTVLKVIICNFMLFLNSILFLMNTILDWILKKKKHIYLMLQLDRFP